MKAPTDDLLLAGVLTCWAAQKADAPISYEGIERIFIPHIEMVLPERFGSRRRR